MNPPVSNRSSPLGPPRLDPLKASYIIKKDCHANTDNKHITLLDVDGP